MDANGAAEDATNKNTPTTTLDTDNAAKSVPTHPRKIVEFVGDSDTVGFGSMS